MNLSHTIPTASNNSSGTLHQFCSSTYIRVCLLPRTSTWHTPERFSLNVGKAWDRFYD